MLNFIKNSEQKKAHNFASRVLKCAKHMRWLMREWQEVSVEAEKIMGEKEQFEKLLPLIGGSKCFYLLSEVQSLLETALEFRREMLKKTNPFDGLGE